ncbi:MAG: site-2 protease family protein [Gloeobacterales cyanobacterium]
MSLVLPLLLISLAFLGWSFFQARKGGKLGILAWLQAVALVLPWLIVFGLAGIGFGISFITLLILLGLSTFSYVWLGSQLRAAAQAQQQEHFAARREELEKQASESYESSVSSSIPPMTVTLPEEEFAVPRADVEKMRGLFGLDTYYLQEVEPYPQGIVFKGNLRGKAEPILQKLAAAFQEVFGDRYRVHLLQQTQEEKPVVLVLAKDNDPFDRPKTPAWIALGLLIIGFGALLEMAANSLDFSLVAAPQRWVEALSIAGITLLTILAHESAHRWQAGKYLVKLSPAYLIPLVSPIPVFAGPVGGFVLLPGVFATLTRLLSPPPSRKALFDIAVAGPAVGGVISWVLLLVGLLLSSLTKTPGPLVVGGDFFSNSILLALTARVTLGTIPMGELVHLHPLVISGTLGLLITGLSLLPCGQLDGGRLVTAVYGRDTARRVGTVTLLILAVTGIFVTQFLFWAAVVFLLGRMPERPCLDDITETDEGRDNLALVALFMMAAILLPASSDLLGQIGLISGIGVGG